MWVILPSVGKLGSYHYKSSISMFDIISMLLEIEALMWNIVLDLDCNVIRICVPTFYRLEYYWNDRSHCELYSICNYDWTSWEVFDSSPVWSSLWSRVGRLGNHVNGNPRWRSEVTSQIQDSGNPLIHTRTKRVPLPSNQLPTNYSILFNAKQIISRGVGSKAYIRDRMVVTGSWNSFIDLVFVRM